MFTKKKEGKSLIKQAVKKYIQSNKNSRVRKLAKQTDASNLIAKYIQLYEKDKIESTKFRTLCYSVKIYSDILRSNWIDDAEKRLKELESMHSSDENDELIFENWK